MSVTASAERRNYLRQRRNNLLLARQDTVYPFGLRSVDAKCLGYGSNVTFTDELGALVEDVGNEQKSKLVSVFGNLLARDLAGC